LLVCVSATGCVRSLALQCIHTKALHNTPCQSSNVVPCTIHAGGIGPFRVNDDN
jgi:hypothetical protein